MALFKKTDLRFNDYAWRTTEGDDAKVRGFPDNVLLNRKEGYEVLGFINRFIEGQQSWRDTPDSEKRELGKKIERLIHDKLPGDTRAHSNVHAWIVQHWNS